MKAGGASHPVFSIHQCCKINNWRKHPMKLTTLFAAASAALILSTNTLAQEAIWQNSYKLEGEKRFNEAISAIDSVQANGADAELKTLRRAWLYYSAGNYSESIREYRYGIERNPRSVDARLGVTLPLLAAKRWREAEQSARAALELAPNNYIALVRLTIALEAQSDWAAMHKAATTLVAAYPTDATAYVYLARANLWLGKKSDGIAAYVAVLSRYPGHPEASAYLNKR
jgi:tetratricopeptide (TPR) repeat protein